MVKTDQEGSIGVTKISVILLSFLYESRYLPEIFSISSSGDSAKLTSKFWPLLNQPASYGPFRKKLQWPLETVFVEKFWNEKNWDGFRPFPVTHWKEIWISWKKRRFEIFRTLTSPSHNNVHALGYKAKNHVYLYVYFHIYFHVYFYVNVIWNICCLTWK